LNFASGLSSKADRNKITLSRLNDQGEREFSDYSLKDINSMKLKDSDEIFIHDLSGKLSNNIRIEGFLSNRGVYSYIENSKISDFIDENDLTDKTYLPFSVISRRDDNGSREFIATDLNLKTREEFNLKPNDFIYVFSQYDIDFINSALLADALGLLSEEDKIKIDLFYQEQRKKNLAEQNNAALVTTPDQSDPFQRQPTKTDEEKREEFNLKSKNLTKFIPDDRYPCKSLKYVAKFNASTLISNLKSLKFSTSETNISDRLGLNEGCPKIFEDNPDLLIVALENASLVSGEIRKPGFYPITGNIS